VRYWKGSIALSSIRDYPLLRQVLRSTFITHGQLYEFMRLEYCATSRNAFNNRVLRLVKHDHLVAHHTSTQPGWFSLIGVAVTSTTCAMMATFRRRSSLSGWFRQVRRVRLTNQPQGTAPSEKTEWFHGAQLSASLQPLWPFLLERLL